MKGCATATLSVPLPMADVGNSWPKITVGLGRFETLGTTRFDLPRVLHWEFYRDLLVHTGSPGVLCGQAPAEGAKDELLWLWIRADEVDISDKGN